MTSENTIELPNLTETEKLHIASKVMSNKRLVKKFVDEHGFDVLESCKNVIDQIVIEQLEEISREEEKRKNHEAAIQTAAQGYIDAMKAAGVEVSMDEALSALTGVNSDSSVTPRKRTASKSTGAPRAPRKEYSFLIGGEVVKRAFARPSSEIKDEMESNDYSEQWMLLAPESVEEFLADAASQQKYKSQIESIKAFFEKKNSGKQEDSEPVALGSKVEYSLALDIETAKDKFDIEMTEDFIFEGNSDQLSSDQEKLLIAISNDETVEGGIEAIEALN
ncbi:hypothetical protein [Vibrio aestuarianus]|uniref:H-NS family histone-like protein n=1 Tax=Vibrio aestuarianus TaxID=28171 RepID=UPI00237C8FF2|nr:hypothetical protein [Vibrio aestuarianus]MDE1271037.1 hypothetical protein [Vibrio aestuarianus]MDH5893434.1 hypothetical protein [Vibrio aestuarianus]WDS56175.1 hypothetical protein MCL29_15385 [Vibrio aestuarianus]WDS59820.1 hypothetical protein MCL31_19675 [Vibrio aestuarianus]